MAALGPLALALSAYQSSLVYNYNVWMGDLRFEWDLIKDVSNQKKHGISFSEAKTVFSDQFARLIVDPDHSDEEERFIPLGTGRCQPHMDSQFKDNIYFT